jgi:FSR family fosmidomycin resistance protein-like MFS transporter
MIATRRLQAPGEKYRAYTLLATLTTGHMVNDFYAMVLPPLVPALLAAFGMSYFQVGLLSFCFYILSGILQPTIGHLSDKYAIRKKVIMAGFLINCAGFIAIGLSPSYVLVLCSSLLCGLGAATFHPQSTNFLARTFPGARGRAMGIHGWGGSIGNFLAPLVVAFLVSGVGWRQGVMFLILPGLLVVALLWSVLEEPRDTKAASFGKGITRELILVSCAFALLSMVLRGFLTFLPTFLVEKGSSLAQAGFFTSLMLFVGLIAQPLGGHIYDKVGGRAIFCVCAVAAGIAMLAFTLSDGLMLVVWTMVVGFFIFALFPVSLAIGSEIAKDDRVGISVGVIFGFSSTLSAFTPIFTGYMADLFGLNLSFQLLVAFAALAALLSLALPGKPNATAVTMADAPAS